MSKYKTKLIVAAIDFGTTYSGYAYSFRDNPLKIYTNYVWSDGVGLATSKAPTVVLFDETGTFHSFGYDAESYYAELADIDEHIGWRYFRRFKMELHNKKSLSLTMELTDDQGRKMPAIDVFAAALKYLKDHLMRRLSEGINDIEETDIQWVLTVPAIWDEPAKQFMKAAAEKAGIPVDQLEIAREPEAAAIYCKELTVSKAKEQGKQAQLKSFDPGAQFMVLDLGGGTMDITAHELEKDGTLKELHHPTGGAWGGTLVDKCIYEHLELLFGKRVMDTFKKDNKSDYLTLERAIELKKRKCTPPKSESAKVVVLSIPLALYQTFNPRKGQEAFQISLEKSVYAKSVTKYNEKLKFDSTIFLKCFDRSIQSLLSQLRILLKKPQLRNIKTIMLVGGFSESEVIKAAVKSALPDLKVNVPEQPDIAVVSGAVMYGHNTNSIRSRIMPYTYGISTAVPFDDEKHPEVKRVLRGGQNKCEDVFKVFIKVGASVVPDVTKVEESVYATFVDSSTATIEIYETASENPDFITDPGCRKVGQVVLELTRQSPNQKKLIHVIMWVGGAMLNVEAKESGTNNQIKATFDCLNRTHEQH